MALSQSGRERGLASLAKNEGKDDFFPHIVDDRMHFVTKKILARVSFSVFRLLETTSARLLRGLRYHRIQLLNGLFIHTAGLQIKAI